MKELVVCEYTKPILDAIKNRVFIEKWKSDFMTKSYSSYQDFYDHLLSLAQKYDTSDNQTVDLRSSKPTPRQDNKKKGKAGGGSNSPVEDKKIKTSLRKHVSCVGKTIIGHLIKPIIIPNHMGIM